MTEVELKQAGLTPDSAKSLRSAFDLVRRCSTAGKLLVGKTLGSLKHLFDAFHSRIRDEKQEQFYVVTLDARHRAIGNRILDHAVVGDGQPMSFKEQGLLWLCRDKLRHSAFCQSCGQHMGASSP